MLRNMKSVICLVFLSSLMVVQLYCVAAFSPYIVTDAVNLQSDLLANYSKKNRPVNTTQVDIQLGLMHITELNIVDQRLHAVGFLIVQWKDERLTWTPSSYGDMIEMFILASDIWTPLLLINNAAEELAFSNDNSDFASASAYVANSGYVGQLVPGNLNSHCSINIKYYPFDSQECEIVISTWLFLKEQLLLQSTATGINLDIYSENGEWDVIKTDVQNVTRVLMGFHMTGVKFVIKLQRKYSYYLLNMLLPVVILAVMAPFVFVLPIESGEKIGYALTILLSLSVVMTLVSDSIPPTSTNVCVLSVYLLMTFIVCSLITIIVVVTCRCHNFHQAGVKMGPRMQRVTRILVNITLSSRFYYQRDHKHGEDDRNNDHKHSSLYSKSTAKVMDINNGKQNGLSKEQVIGQAWDGQKPDMTKDEVEEECQREYTWEDFAVLSDKFNFCFTTAFTVIVTLGCMIALQSGRSS